MKILIHNLFFCSVLCYTSATYSQDIPTDLESKNWFVNYLVINNTIYNKPQESSYKTEGYTVMDESDMFYLTFSSGSGLYGIDTHFCYDTGSPITFYEDTNLFELNGDFIGGTLRDCGFQENRDYDGLIYDILDSLHNPFSYKVYGDDPVNLYISNSQNDTLFLYDKETMNILSSYPYISQFPNPVQDELLINLDAAIHKVVIYDLYGSKILESRQKKIDVIGLSKGLYLVKISSTTGVVTIKMIKS